MPYAWMNRVRPINWNCIHCDEAVAKRAVKFDILSGALPLPILWKFPCTLPISKRAKGTTSKRAAISHDMAFLSLDCDHDRVWEQGLVFIGLVGYKCWPVALFTQGRWTVPRSSCISISCWVPRCNHYHNKLGLGLRTVVEFLGLGLRDAISPVSLWCCQIMIFPLIRMAHGELPLTNFLISLTWQMWQVTTKGTWCLFLTDTRFWII